MSSVERKSARTGRGWGWRAALRTARGARNVSVRTRILASVLVMSALGLAVSGAVANAIQTQRILDGVDADLSQEVEEFRTLASRGVDPETGERFRSVDQLLVIALERNVPSSNEMFLTYLGGQPHRYSAGGVSEILTSDAVREAVTAVPAAATSVVNQDVQASIGTVRLSIVPVRVQDNGATGTYVIAPAVDRDLEQQTDLMRTYALVSLGALLLIGAVGWLVAGRLMRPVALLSATTQRIGETDLRERVAVSGNDDVSDLARTFNAMLDRLEKAFETQREFLDDAGHELKTPVTILRGHLELMDPDDATDFAQTRALLLDEVDRMSRLVQDLIVLAKAERSDFVQLQRVDLGQLTDEVLDKARGLGERHWRVDHRAEATVLADPQRLTQALLQLADNAVKFTQPGATIAIGTSIDVGQARLWVRDDGPGVAPDDLDRIFARFGRAQTGRGVEGSGLGLAIVRAIAEAHQGWVDVARVEPRGVIFTVVLPLAGHPVPRPTRTDETTGVRADESVVDAQ